MPPSQVRHAHLARVRSRTIGELELKTLKILLIDDQDDHAGRLEQELRDAGCALIERSSEQRDLQALVAAGAPDAVIIGLKSPGAHILENIRAINRKCPVPVILFAEDNDSATIQNVIRAGASAYVVDGIQAARIQTVVQVAIARFNEQQSLRAELEQTREKLEERTLVDRAKWILIREKRMSEEEAYHSLRKLAMDRNMRIGEMAKNVISIAELLDR